MSVSAVISFSGENQIGECKNRFFPHLGVSVATCMAILQVGSGLQLRSASTGTKEEDYENDAATIVQKCVSIFLQTHCLSLSLLLFFGTFLQELKVFCGPLLSVSTVESNSHPQSLKVKVANDLALWWVQANCGVRRSQCMDRQVRNREFSRPSEQSQKSINLLFPFCCVSQFKRVTMVTATLCLCCSVTFSWSPVKQFAGVLCFISLTQVSQSLHCCHAFPKNSTAEMLTNTKFVLATAGDLWNDWTSHQQLPQSWRRGEWQLYWDSLTMLPVQ